MSYPDFNETKYIFATDTSTVTKLGYIQTDTPIEVEAIRVDFYKHGTEVGDEVFKLNLYSDDSCTTIFSSSGSLALSTVPNPGTYWLGWVRFDFDSLPILGGPNKYYIGLEPVTYTRVADTFYVGVSADTPDENINKIGAGVGAYLEIYTRSTSDVCG